MTAQKKETFLKDYTPPAYLVDSIHLRIELDPKATQVEAKLQIRPNTTDAQPLVLNGKRLELVGVAVEGTELAPAQYSFADGLLTVPQVPSTPFE
ncbi:MAG: hypothetical protein AB7U29_14765 [Desulfobulbus sp.]